MVEHPNVISIFENRDVRRQTTQSWEFLGSFQHQVIPTKESIWEKANFGEDMIIAGIDTGKFYLIVFGFLFNEFLN